MTQTPNPNRAAGAPTPHEERWRERGSQLVITLSAVIRVARAYKAGNQVLRRQLDNIMEALRPAFEEEGEAVLAQIDNDLYLNGNRIPVNASSFRFQETVVETFKSRGIQGFRAERGVGIEELAKFFELFLHGDGLVGPAFLEACQASGVVHILPAVHASTEVPGAEDFFAGDNFDMSPEPAAPSGGGSRNISRTGRRRHGQAVREARSLLTTTSLHDGLELRHAKRVVQPLVDAAFKTEAVVVGLSSLQHHDEYTYAHAVNVCAVAVTMGHCIGLDRRALADIGVAALLHDVGKASIGDRIEHEPEEFTEAEQAAVERHTVEGAKLIARSTTLNPTTMRCMQVALEHHAGPGGVGYPAFPTTHKLSLLSRIVAVADCYVGLQVHRPSQQFAVTPYEALGMMLGPLQPRFDPALLWALVESVGFYPPGQLVQIEDGSIAIVVAPNSADLSRPNALVIVDEEGRRLPPEERRELKPIPQESGVLRPLRAYEYPEDAPGVAAPAEPPDEAKAA